MRKQFTSGGSNRLWVSCDKFGSVCTGLAVGKTTKKLLEVIVMTNETVLERTSNLVMPSHYVELDREEMSYVDGGAWYHWLIAGVIGAVCAVGITFLTAGTGAVTGATVGIKAAKWLGIAAVGAAGGCGSYGISLIP